jgi:hypothetical protein
MPQTVLELRSSLFRERHGDSSMDAETTSPVKASLDRRTVRKLDTVLLPFLALLFLFNSLDRSNVGPPTHLLTQAD